MDAVMPMRYNFQEPRQREYLNGKYVSMSRPSMRHANTVKKLLYLLDEAVKSRQYYVIFEPDVFLGDDNVIPDLVVVRSEIVKSNGIYGPPELVAEVLSPATLKRDKGYKKDLYERHGVREYWIVDTENKAVEIYTLANDRYTLANAAVVIPDDALAKMRDDEKAEIITSVASVCFPDLVVGLEDIFENIP